MRMCFLTKYFRRFYAGVCVTLLSIGVLGTISGCGSLDAEKQEDVLTQNPVSDNKENITILVKYAFTIHGFEKAVEEKFPNINIIQVGNYTSGNGIDEYEARLKNDDLPDMVMTWPLSAGEEFCEVRLMDLSGMEFTSRYNLSMLNDISKDGKLYYLPGPSQVRGIVYNKTLFEENGWKVPEDFEGFMELCKTIEDTGIRALQLGFKNPEVLDTAFTGFSYADCYSMPQDTRWINEYNNGEHSFGEHFGTALDTFQQLIDEGILKDEDMDIGYSMRETMLFTRQCAMAEDSVLLTRMGESLTGSKDEFALMPFFNPNGGGKWARLYMVCYIGLNRHLAEPENKEKYDIVMELMDYISTPEGQTALMSDTGAMYSSLTEVGAPQDIPEINDLIPVLEEGNYAVFPELKNAQSALRQGLAGMVRGELSKQSVITLVDAQNMSPPKSDRPKVLGSATEDFTLLETGNFVADAMREAGDCDIALFLDNGKDGRYNGKGISGRLYKGEVTNKDTMRIFPDLKHQEKGILQKISMTGENLIKTLEYAIEVDNDAEGWFYYFSGLRMEYAPSAKAGERIHKITLEDKSEIEPEKVYTIAAMDLTVSEEYMESCEDTEMKVLDIISDAIKNSKTISPSKDGRFIIAEP